MGSDTQKSFRRQGVATSAWTVGALSKSLGSCRVSAYSASNLIQPPSVVVSRTGLRPRWVEVGGKRFYARSNWEANYGCYLEWLKANRQIRDWTHEPRTYWFKGVRRGSVSYLPDFEVVENNGRTVLYEVKGFMDSKSRTKLKRMAKYYPSIVIRIIDRKQYASLRDKVGGAIHGWI